MKKYQILLVLIFFPLILFAQSEWKIKSSAITFKIKNAGLNVSGFFKGFKGDIKFDPNNLKSSSISVSVDVATINTGINARDKHLRSDDYFNAEKYPQITMKSIRFAKSESSNYIAYFDLTIRDVTKEVKVPFKFNKNSNKATVEAYFSVNRRDFKVGGGSVILSNTANLDIKLEIYK